MGLEFEDINKVSPERKAVIEDAEKKRKRVDELGKKSESGEDLVYDLAKEEDDYRESLKEKGIIADKKITRLIKEKILKKKSITEKGINDIADNFSDKTLEKMEVLQDLREAEKTSLIDPMTGEKNRRALQMELPKDLGRAERENLPCSILMIDIDNFKKINDTYGHPDGDAVIINLASIIKNTIRKTDNVYRYGGEEFTVLLFDASSAEGIKLAEKIRQNVEKVTIKTENAEFKFAISIGCCGTDQLGDYDADELIKKADEALYKSKKDGKNRVTSCAEIMDKKEK